jgi:hypothetical protein
MGKYMYIRIRGFQNIFTNGSYKLDPAVATDNQRPEGLWNK